MQNLIITKKNNYVVIELNQGKVNTLNSGLITDMRTAFREAKTDERVKGVILMGKPGIFSAGLDLIEMYNLERSELNAFIVNFENMYADMAQFPKPFICGISGHSPAGGCVMAITADHRIMAEGDTYTIGLNEVAVNIQISPEIVKGYAFWIGDGKAHKYLMDSKLLSVKEAFDCGLVDEVCPIEDVLLRAEKKMQEYLKADEEVFVKTKAITRQSWLQVFGEKDEEFRLKAFNAHWWKPETRTRLKGFLEALATRKNKRSKPVNLSHLEDIDRKEFLTKELPNLLVNLNNNTVPTFGLMTPQHMIEHLTWIIKSSVKRYGEPEGAPTEKQLGFKRFIQKGAIFEHRPNKKTKADLPELKYPSLEKAMEQLPIAIDRFYTHFEAQPDFKSFSPIMGELSFQELELFHFMHVRYHLWQFGLLPEYP